MKIFEINSYNSGSTGNMMLNIAEIAKSHGNIVYTSCPDSRSMRQKRLENNIYISNIIERNLHIFAAKITGYNGCFSHIGTMCFLKRLDEIEPDILHLHNLHNCYLNLSLLFNWINAKKVKVVWTLHDCWAFTGHCPHFTMVKCERWKTGCYDCPQYRSYPQSLVDRSQTMYELKRRWFTGVRNMTIVTPSNWLADLVQQSFLKEYPVDVIHNGIDLTIFKPTESDFRVRYCLQNKFIVLGVAYGWDKRKGLDVFIDLAKELDDRFKIILVGTDSNIDKQLVGNILSIHRTCNQKELAKIYTAVDVFVNPTREEVLGLVNLEALACGTPVVTFRSGGSPECIDETCGLVVERDDRNALLNSLMYIYEKRPFSKESCQKRAEKFDREVRLGEYITLYERSCSESQTNTIGKRVKMMKA